jgi:Riboflavin kinase
MLVDDQSTADLVITGDQSCHLKALETKIVRPRKLKQFDGLLDVAQLKFDGVNFEPKTSRKFVSL